MNAPVAVFGVLLAAGRGERFGGAKLVAPLEDGEAVGVVALRNLLAAVRPAIAVVRPGDEDLARCLHHAGARIVVAEHADDGLGASLAAGVAAVPATAGIVVALADMPWILPSTIARVATWIGAGASLAAPFHDGQRGHPVGFGPEHRAALSALRGDEGARAILAEARDRLARIDVDDPGVLRDVDTRADLGR